jgi:hypothetical protein
MVIKLENLDPKFREQTDLLLFGNSTDLDINNFILLLHNNYTAHFEYFLNRFVKSCDIFWENNAEVWFYKLNFILSLKDKNISGKVSSFLEKRMASLTRRKFCISPKYDVEFLQYQILCQVKKERNESLEFACKFLEELPSFFKIDNTIEVVKHFIPIVYSKIEEYAENISRKIGNSSKNFVMLKALENHGVPYDRKWLIELANSLLTERVSSDKNKRLFFALISDAEVLAGLKEKYSSLHKKKLTTFLSQCDFSLIEATHLSNIKNVLELDSSLIESVVKIYINKLYSRQFTHTRSNADRLIKLIKKIDLISPRIVFSCLSTKNKMGDIKYMLPHFPEVKNIAAFL